jgi:hypothetical protein
MISELAESDDRQKVFVIQPNPPLAWSTLFGVFAAMAGLPLVLPFSGLEVLVLGVALYLSAVRGSVREVIRIQDAAVVYEAGRSAPVVTRTFQRHWTRVVLEQSCADWYPSACCCAPMAGSWKWGDFSRNRNACNWDCGCNLRCSGTGRKCIFIPNQSVLTNAED